MSNIDDLIEKLCPDGVKYSRLGEKCKVLRGKRLTKKELSENGKYPVFHGGLIPLGRYNEYNRNANQTMIINTGSVGEVVWSNVDFWSSDGTFVIETPKNINDKFLFFYLKTQESFLKAQKREGGVPTIERNAVEKISIPIPPLKIQDEIVRTLDSFTQLEAELEAELEARKTQYTYYRDALLSFEGKNVEWKTLGEVGEIRRGVAFTKKQSISGKYPVVANAPSPISYHNEANRSGECIVIARSGANAGLVSYWNEKLFLTDAFSIHPDNALLNTKFIFYYLKNLQREIHLMKKGSGVPHVRASDFELYNVPIPPLKEQERIVKILDQFDALVSDISIGLPAEIEARRKQYEYYRNKLLTFKNVNNG